MNSAIFEGQVRHRRLRPVEHRFAYRVFMMYLDLAELDQVFKGRWAWSQKRPALARVGVGRLTRVPSPNCPCRF